MFPGLHWPELIIVVVIALLFFGPKRLPEMGSAIGKTIKEFQKSMREVTHPTEAPAQTLPTASGQPTQTPQISAATEPARETVATTNTMDDHPTA